MGCFHKGCCCYCIWIESTFQSSSSLLFNLQWWISCRAVWLSSPKSHWEKLSPAEGLGGIFPLPFSAVPQKGLVPPWFWARLLSHLVLRESLSLHHFLSACLTDGCVISCLYRMFKVSQISHHFYWASAPHWGLTFLPTRAGTGHSVGKVSELCPAGSEVFSIQRLGSTSLFGVLQSLSLSSDRTDSSSACSFSHLIWIVINSQGCSLLCDFHLKIEMDY